MLRARFCARVSLFSRRCDHLHDGLGFLTQHAALTLAFERALQRIDPSVTIPCVQYYYY